MSSPTLTTPYSQGSRSPHSAQSSTLTLQNIPVEGHCSKGTNLSIPGSPSSSTSDLLQSKVTPRRQYSRNRFYGGVKLSTFPTRFRNLSNDFEFATWGSVSRLELTPDQIKDGDDVVQAEKCTPFLGAWMASAVAANEVFGSVFYAFPAIVFVAGIFSPISLFVATLSLFLWRPIVEELASAFSKNGANYTYLINTTSKSLALIGGAFALLDYATTIIVSAATASTYVSGELQLPFPVYVGSLLLLVTPVCISLSGLRESARVAAGIMSFHMITMLVLATVSLVAWITRGNGQLRENWVKGQPENTAALARQIFNGVCIGVLGLTGFECSPDYSCTVHPSNFPRVLRNIHLPALLLYGPLMFLVFAILPMEVIVGGSNVLSILAENAAGNWMQIWVVADAAIVLSAGVLTGILSACALCEQLSRDRILPQIFQYRLPKTGAQAVTIGSFVLLSVGLYASTGAQLQLVSKIFAMTWLSVMTLFPISLLFLKFNRGRIPRARRAPLPLVIITLLFAGVAMAGNIALDPPTIVYFSAYAIGIALFFLVSANRANIVREMYWVYDQSPALHDRRWARRWEATLVRWFKGLRKQAVGVCVKGDEIRDLSRMITYVSRNEETSCIKLVHLYDNEDDIPSELEANAKVLDEAFPEITVDLLFVHAPFTPAVIAALARQLNIPRSLMFMSCPCEDFKIKVAELGMRVICSEEKDQRIDRWNSGKSLEFDTTLPLLSSPLS